MMERQGVESCAGWVDDDCIGADEVGLAHEVGDHFADVPLMDGHVQNYTLTQTNNLVLKWY